MSSDVHRAKPSGSKLGIATRELRVRVLNWSLSGCLLETNAHLDMGTTASLRMTIDGDESADDVEVVRCQLVEGAGSLYQVAVRFLWTAPLHPRAIRHVAWRCCEGPATES
jgi:hypothetical protein